MADFTTGPNGAGGSIPAGKFVNISAAAVSVALMAGVGIWGFKLLVRDVSGVPVVEAKLGEMRVAPENPGGEIASNIGLSVNSVPAEGGAAEPEDRLVLAPSNVALQAEDLEMVPTAEATEVAPISEVEEGEVADAVPVALTDETSATPEIAAALTTPVDPSTPLTADDVLALADQIAAGATPLSDLAEGVTAPIEVAVNGVTVDPNIVPDAVPGVRRSPRPSVRPSALNTSAPAATSAVAQPVETATATQASTPVTGEVTTATIPVGTKLVQLGAFDSADIAASEWSRLTGQFPDFFDGKDQIIQEAASGGRTFYRLRAMGFADLNDARRFCSAMSAEGAACIPVVVR